MLMQNKCHAIPILFAIGIYQINSPASCSGPSDGQIREFFRSIKRADASGVVQYLQSGISPNILAHDSSESPLQVAARAGSQETVKTLLEYGADVHYVSESGNALHAALDFDPTRPSYKKKRGTSNSHLVVYHLIKAGIDVTANNPEGETPIALACRLDSFIRKHKPQTPLLTKPMLVILQLLKENSVAEVSQPAMDVISSPLFQHQLLSASLAKSTVKDRTVTMALLLSLGADAGYAQHIIDRTADQKKLHILMDNRPLKLPPEMVNATDALGRTPLHIAATLDYWVDEFPLKWVTLRLMQSDARTDIKNNAGLTPTETAIAAGHPERAAWIEKYRKLQLSCKLYQAVEKDYFVQAEQLLELGTDINARHPNFGRHSPIEAAARKKSSRMITLLLSKGATIEDKYALLAFFDETGITSFPPKPSLNHMSRPAIDLFMDRVSPGIINASDSVGYTALHRIATSSIRDGLAQHLIDKLVAAGAQPEATATYSITPADRARNHGLDHRAIYIESLIVPSLLQRGMDAGCAQDIINRKQLLALTNKIFFERSSEAVNAIDASGQTPLHIAATIGHWPDEDEIESVIRRLIQNGANTDAKNATGLSPIESAIAAGHPERAAWIEKYRTEQLSCRLCKAIEKDDFAQAEQLLELGADINVNGSPIRIAAWKKSSEMITLLLSRGAIITDHRALLEFLRNNPSPLSLNDISTPAIDLFISRISPDIINKLDDTMGFNALHHVARMTIQEVLARHLIDKLITAGADPKATMRGYSSTPADIARHHGFYSRAAYIESLIPLMHYSNYIIEQ